MLTHKGTKTLKTERLTLRRYTEADAQDMFNNWANDAAVTKFLTWQPHESAEATRELLHGWVQKYENPDYYHWTIEYEGKPIGGISVANIREKSECAEIGYCIARSCWNKGIITEALKAVCDFLFDEIGFNRLEIRHAPENPASGRAAKKCGFIQEGTARQCMRTSTGELCDLVMLGCLKSDRR